MRCETYAEYIRLKMIRQEIISENAARRMRRIHQEPLPVPENPEPPLRKIWYERDGTYIGWESDQEWEPKEASAYFRMEPAAY